MGCWNGTCGISQMPIHAGQRIWAFLIGVAGYGDSCGPSGHCYSTDLGFPMSLPIRGEYNDYGGIEGIEENYNTQLILDTYLNSEGNKFSNIYTFLNDYVERDNYVHFTTDDEYCSVKKFPVGIFMVIEDVALSFKGLRTSYEKYCRTLPRGHLRQDAKYFMEFAADRLPKLEDLYGDEDLRDSLLFNSRSDECKKTGRFSNKFAWIYNSMGAAGAPIYDAWRPYRKYIIELVRQGKTSGKEVEELIRDTCDYDLVCRALGYMRKSWVPQAGKGSQSEDYEFYWKLTTAMRRQMKRIRDERARWEEEGY